MTHSMSMPCLCGDSAVSTVPGMLLLVLESACADASVFPRACVQLALLLPVVGMSCCESSVFVLDLITVGSALLSRGLAWLGLALALVGAKFHGCAMDAAHIYVSFHIQGPCVLFSVSF